MPLTNAKKNSHGFRIAHLVATSGVFDIALKELEIVVWQLCKSRIDLYMESYLLGPMS